MAFRQRTIQSYSVILFIIIIFLGLGFTRPNTAKAAGILYVDWQATGANDGSSWSDAFTNLQSALTAAGSGDEIWVAQGTYQPGNQRTDSFNLKTGVAVYGGFAATETARDERDWIEHMTILSGDIDPTGDEDSYHVVTGSGVNATAILDGFTITGARADGDSPHDSGGGIYNAAGSPALRNVVIKGNLASYGGGIYNLDSSPTLVNALVLDNSGTDGGGMYNTNSSPSVINVTFSANGVTKNGSAIANVSNSNPSITNSILWGNKSPSLHQIYDENSTPNISYTDIQGPPKPGPGNLNSNPQFVDVSNRDFRLQAESPAIDAGDNSVLPADSSDLDGDGDTTEVLPYDAMRSLRSIDDPAMPDTGTGTAPIVDMGAYEFQYPNNAPLLDSSGDPFLAPIAEDDQGNNGTLVSAILASGSNASLISDPDPDAQPGIAVIAVDEANGLWQYSTDGGGTWTDFAAVADTSAVLLAATTNDRVRFVPGPDYFGILNPGITFRAWDGSDGRASGNRQVNVSQNGGGTAYSSAAESASITINPVDDPPAISPIADLTTKIGQAAGSVAFSIADIDTPLSDLSLSGSSSNPNLVSADNISFGGSGADRTVTISPTPFVSGEASITITVRDATASAQQSFLLAVSGMDLYLPAVLRADN